MKNAIIKFAAVCLPIFFGIVAVVFATASVALAAEGEDGRARRLVDAVKNAESRTKAGIRDIAPQTLTVAQWWQDRPLPRFTMTFADDLDRAYDRLWPKPDFTKTKKARLLDRAYGLGQLPQRGLADGENHDRAYGLLWPKNPGERNCLSPEKEPDLHRAARHAADAEIRRILDNGTNPDQPYCGITALEVAAAVGHSKIVQTLLDRGANPNQPRALRAAKGKWHAETVKILLAAKKANQRKTARSAQSGDSTSPRIEREIVVQTVFTSVVQTVFVAAPSAPPNFGKQVFDSVWRSIVFIENGSSQGSGVIVKPNLVATNCHVVESRLPIEVYKSSNRKTNRKRGHRGEIAHDDLERDFCLVEVENLRGQPAQIRKYDSLEVGEQVYGLGAPQGLDLSLSSGVISQLRNIEGKRIIQTDTAISPGSSGGGLFDRDGKLIGLTTSGFSKAETEGLNFAIPADLALRF